eukprot:TRINITY_DN12876_c0_g1_i1.p1 TRINITY_DN12876_c0_g1~~TRINITY_DN12876_c0_g1_i1.p1  ORF type:complete len:895 (+),score=274.86 TRINITY_DN12876_c0_g1_i1:372-2687(+)
MNNWDNLSLEEKEIRINSMFHNEFTKNLPLDWDEYSEEEREQYYLDNFEKIEDIDQILEWKGDTDLESTDRTLDKLGDLPKNVRERAIKDAKFREELLQTTEVDEFGDKVILAELGLEDTPQFEKFEEMEKEGVIDSFIEELKELTDPEDPEPIPMRENIEISKGLLDDLSKEVNKDDVLNSFSVNTDADSEAKFLENAGNEGEAEDDLYDFSGVSLKGEKKMAELTLLSKLMETKLDMIKEQIRNIDQDQETVEEQAVKTEQLEQNRIDNESLLKRIERVKHVEEKPVPEPFNLDMDTPLKLEDLGNIPSSKAIEYEQKLEAVDMHMPSDIYMDLQTEEMKKSTDAKAEEILSNISLPNLNTSTEISNIHPADQKILDILYEKHPELNGNENVDVPSILRSFLQEHPQYSDSPIFKILNTDELVNEAIVSDDSSHPIDNIITNKIEELSEKYPELKLEEMEEYEELVQENQQLDYVAAKITSMLEEIRRKGKEISAEDAVPFEDTVTVFENHEEQNNTKNQLNVSNTGDRFLSSVTEMDDNFQEFNSQSNVMPTMENNEEQQQRSERITQYNNSWDYLKAVGIFDTEVIDIQEKELNNLSEVKKVRGELANQDEYIDQFQKQYPLYGEEMDNFGVNGDKATKCGAGACIFCSGENNSYPLEPMNVPLLLRYMNRFGFIKPKRMTGLCSKMQRRVARTINQARNLGLFSYKYGRFEVLYPLVEKDTPLYLEEEIGHRIKELMRYKEDAKEIKRYLRWSTKPESSKRISQKL